MLDDGLQKKGAIISARAGASVGTGHSTRPIVRIGGLHAVNWIVDEKPTIRWSTDHKCYTSLWYRCRLPKVALLASLGLLNPPSLLWETRPLSFVLDWFIPIGPWLQSMTADAGWDFLSGTQSYKREVSVQNVAPGTLKYNGPFTPTGSNVILPSFSKAKAEYFSRRVYKSRPVPGIYYKNPLSASHAISGIALLIQAFR